MQKTLYIFSDGALRREDSTLCYETEEGKRFLPVEEIRRLRPPIRFEVVI